MPVWHARTKAWREQGRLEVLGVAQEHHGDRCRLFAQWQGFDFPILHDPINFMGTRGVPIVVAIDEHGIVRAVNPKADDLEASFLDKSFDAPEASTAPAPVPLPDPEALARGAKSADDWRNVGDALALWGGAGKVDGAIDAYSRAARLDPSDGRNLFRLGVSYARRHESEHRRTGDFRKAVEQWSAALATDPGQYIWRRRIEQYGPRLGKPYPFYDWVGEAAQAVKARGETPVALRVVPGESEMARPARSFSADTGEAVSPDPEGRIPRDVRGLIEAEIAVAPPRVRPGGAARVHVILRPSGERKAHWNNLSEPLRLWIELPEGWQADRRLITLPQPREEQSAEARRLEFGLRLPADLAPGPAALTAYVLYSVCEDETGACHLLRRDIRVEIDVVR